MLRFEHTIPLDGLWDFAFVEGPSELDDAAILSTPCPEIQPVPGCFDALPPRYSRRGVGIYRRTLRAGGRLMLRFRGLGLRAKVFWDRQPLGDIPWPFTPAEFLIEDAPEGEHELTVAVSNVPNESPSSLFHEFYDFYSFGGIYRPVELRQLAGNYVRELQVTPLDAATGAIRIRLAVERPQPGAVVSFLLDGTPLGQRPLDGDSLEWETCVPSPHPWTPADPHLCRLRAELPFDAAETEFGLRTLSWQDGLLRLNGQPLKLMGFCRHDSHPETGYAIPPSRVLADLQMLKGQGCNFIRGSHYMQSDFLLDCCDRMGILVWEESCGWGNKAPQCADERFRQLQEEQTRRMVREHYNHPCIILWGFMNELSSDTPEAYGILERLFAAVHAEDASRPATFASNRTGQDAVVGRDICFGLADVIATNVYPGWYPGWSHDAMTPHDEDNVPEALAEVERFLAVQPECAGKPWLISEVGAAAILGNHNGVRWSEEYQERLVMHAVRFAASSPHCTGIAIWQFANANTHIAGTGILSRPNGFNNKGLLTEHRQPKMAWHALGRFLRGE